MYLHNLVDAQFNCFRNMQIIFFTVKGCVEASKQNFPISVGISLR